VVQILNDAVTCNPRGMREAGNANNWFHLTHSSKKMTYTVLSDELQSVQFMN